MAYNEAGQSPLSEVLQATPVKGRHAYYDFEEEEGTLVKDKWGAYQGNLRNEASWEAGRMYLTNAVALDKANESYIELEDGILSTLHDFTLSSWVKFPEDIGNNARFFDFGSGTGTFMILAPKSGSRVRYKITSPAGTYNTYISYDLPLGEWVHVAITQQNDTFKFYVNGELQYSDGNATVYPEDMGYTTNNYLGRSQWSSDPYANNVYDDFKIYNYALSEEELLEDLKSPQVITFEKIQEKYIGDPDFTLNAVSSSALKVAYSTSNSSVAVVDTMGVVHITGVGTTKIIADQVGNKDFLSAKAVQSLTVYPINLQVMYLDGNNLENDNSIAPYFQVVNNDNIAVDMEEITARYWLTMENYNGASVYIHYAKLGDKVSAKYVELEEPHDNALGYVEYSFDEGTGMLDPENSTGSIQSMIANFNWEKLDESNDYSRLKGATSYQLNENVTLYRNGQLIWGKEPELEASYQLAQVKSLSKDNSPTTIGVYLVVDNQGNTPLQYNDLSLRYWFTSEGDQQLNYWIDYALLNKNGIIGGFEKLIPEKQNADTYFELSMDSTFGTLYPLTSTGNIQLRISKSDWSVFSETNDYSYKVSDSFVANDKITVYYKGELIYGIEPSNVTENASQIDPEEADNEMFSVSNKEELSHGVEVSSMTEYASQVGFEIDGNEVFSVYPNPVIDNLTINLKSEALVTVSSITGKIVWKKTIFKDVKSLDFSYLPKGVYVIQVQNEKMYAVKKIIKE